MPKSETYKHGTNGASVYVGICKDSIVEIDTRRENAGERSKFGPSVLMTFTEARALAEWLLANTQDSK